MDERLVCTQFLENWMNDTELSLETANWSVYRGCTEGICMWNGKWGKKLLNKLFKMDLLQNKLK